MAASGGLTQWNQHPTLKALNTTVGAACRANSVKEAVAEVRGLLSLGHALWAYVYMRELYARNPDVYYATLLSEPALLERRIHPRRVP